MITSHDVSLLKKIYPSRKNDYKKKKDYNSFFKNSLYL